MILCWIWRGKANTHQLNSNLPGRFLSLELPLYRAPIVSRRRRANPNHSLARSLSWSVSAQRGFVRHNSRGLRFRHVRTRLRDCQGDLAGASTTYASERGVRPLPSRPSECCFVRRRRALGGSLHVSLPLRLSVCHRLSGHVVRK